jgi:hypothetical protein
LSCSTHETGVQASSEFRPGTDLSLYSGYAWDKPAQPLPDPARATDNELIDWRVRSAVDEELQLRGFRATSEGPRALVDYWVDWRHQRVDSFRDYAEYKSSGGKQDMIDASVSGFQVAVLTVVLMDASTRTPLWRGVVEGVALQADNPAERLRAAVQKMFAGFPHIAGSP